MAGELQWWQRAVIYQVVVSSFADSDGDGRGDLRGLVDKLDYLAWLGVDALWLSPIYPSPLRSLGYDVTNFVDVHQAFGGLEALDRLLAEAHRRGLRVILDFVPNHTSDQHPWFLESRASRDNPRRDWYIWHDPRPDGSPPSNWICTSGDSAWTLDKATGQYYFHSFPGDLPDLNWRNPEVQQAILDAMRFWLDRGVDGFRLDVLWMLVKDNLLRDNPPNPDYKPGRPPDESQLTVYTRNRPEVMGPIALMRQLVDAYGDRLLGGEIYASPEDLAMYYGAGNLGVHFGFNMYPSIGEWSVSKLAGTIEDYELCLPEVCWRCWGIGTHDSRRVATRAGAQRARGVAMLLLTMRGTLSLYYGDEIGMHDVPRAADDPHDPRAQNPATQDFSRDIARTPMQWDGSPLGGFTTGKPWLPLAEDVAAINVAAQRDDPRSLLSLYRRLIALRKQEPALVEGRYVPLLRGEQLWSYCREHQGRRLAVVLSFGPEPQTFRFAEHGVAGRVLLSTTLEREGEPVSGAVELAPFEGVIVELGS